MSRREDVTEEGWMAIFQNLQGKDVEWRAPWMMPGEILYRCGDFNWVPLPGIWGVIGYAPLLAARQYQSRQFVPATHGLSRSEFTYTGEGYKKKIKETANAWKLTHRMKRLAAGETATSEYKAWLSKRINDNIPGPSLDNAQSLEERLRVIPTELEIIKQDFV